MDVTKLLHDASKVKAALMELEDGTLVTTKALKIHLPVRYTDRGLATIGSEIYIVGVCGFILEDKYYAYQLVNAMMRITPSGRRKVVVNGDEYNEFLFEPGCVVIASLDLVQTDTLVYNVYDEILQNGKIPWYLNYQTVSGLFDSARKYAGANVGGKREVVELLISLLARSQQDRTVYYRELLTDESDLKTIKPVFIPLESSAYTPTNTLDKLTSSYFDEAVFSSLANPSERVEDIERILRT